MITQWRQQQNGDYVGHWQGVTIVIYAHAETELWRGKVTHPGRPEVFPDVWVSAQKAMDAINAAQHRLTMEKVAAHRRQ